MNSLRDTINASIAEGGSFTDDEVGAYLAEQSEKLVEERDGKLQYLRDTINASIEAGGQNTVEDVSRALDALDDELAKYDLSQTDH